MSLLWRKHGPSGTSEFSFDSFCGGFDTAAERRGRPSFQEWLDCWHKERAILVVEHPTYDFCPVPPDVLDAVASDVVSFLLKGRTVVLMDSGGETRTRVVCKHIGFIEDTRAP